MSLPHLSGFFLDTKMSKKHMAGSPKHKKNHHVRSPHHDEWKTYRRSREHKNKKNPNSTIEKASCHPL